MERERQLRFCLFGIEIQYHTPKYGSMVYSFKDARPSSASGDATMNFAATQEFQSLSHTMREAFQSVQALQTSTGDGVRALHGLWRARAGLKHMSQESCDIRTKVDALPKQLSEEHVNGLAACLDNMQDVYATAKKLPWALRIFILGDIKAAYRDLDGLRWAILEHNADLADGSSQILKTPSEIDKFFSSI